MSLFFHKPNLIKLIQNLFDTIFVHLLVLEFHFQHDFITSSRCPDQTFINFYLTTTASPLSFELLVKTIAFQSFRNILEVMDFLEIISEVTKFLVLFCIFEEKNQSFDGLLGLVKFEQLCPFGLLAHVYLIHVVFHLVDLLLEKFINTIQIFDFALIVLLVELQRLNFEEKSIYFLLLMLKFVLEFINFAILLFLFLQFPFFFGYQVITLESTQLMLQLINFFILFPSHLIQFEPQKLILFFSFTKFLQEKYVILPRFGVLLLSEGDSGLQILLFLDLYSLLDRIDGFLTRIPLVILPLYRILDLLIVLKQFMIAFEILLIILQFGTLRILFQIIHSN